MKTRAFKYLKLMLLALAMVNLTSCEVEIGGFWDHDDYSPGYYEKSSALCSRTWADDYIDADGNRCHQELDFYMDRTGIDYIVKVYPDGGVYRNEYRFRWNWENYGQTALRMVYAPGDYSILDRVQIRGNVLSGYLDGWDNYVDYIGLW